MSDNTDNTDNDTKARLAEALDECARLRRFNTRLSEATGGRFIFAELDTSTDGTTRLHLIVSPDTPDEQVAHSIASHLAGIYKVKFDNVHLAGHPEPITTKD